MQKVLRPILAGLKASQVVLNELNARGKAGNRSSKVTDALHLPFSKYLESLGYKVQLEGKIPSWINVTGIHKADMVVQDEKVVFEFKHVKSSYAKNHANFAKNLLSEVKEAEDAGYKCNQIFIVNKDLLTESYIKIWKKFPLHKMNILVLTYWDGELKPVNSLEEFINRAEILQA